MNPSDLNCQTNLPDELMKAARLQGLEVARHLDERLKDQLTVDIEDLKAQIALLEIRLLQKKNRMQEVERRLGVTAASLCQDIC